MPKTMTETQRLDLIMARNAIEEGTISQEDFLKFMNILSNFPDEMNQIDADKIVLRFSLIPPERRDEFIPQKEALVLLPIILQKFPPNDEAGTFLLNSWLTSHGWNEFGPPLDQPSISPNEVIQKSTKSSRWWPFKNKSIVPVDDSRSPSTVASEATASQTSRFTAKMNRANFEKKLEAWLKHPINNINPEYLLELAKALTKESCSQSLKKIFNELVQYPYVAQQFISNLEVLYWLSLPRGVEPNTQKTIEVSRIERVELLLAFCGGLEQSIWNDFAVNLNQPENSPYKAVIQQAFKYSQFYDEHYKGKIDWDFSGKMDTSTSSSSGRSSEEEEHDHKKYGTSTFKRDNTKTGQSFQAGKKGFFALVTTSSIQDYKEVGNNLYNGFNGQSTDTNTKFDARCREFFQEFRENPEKLIGNLNNIVAVLMNADVAEINLKGGVKAFASAGYASRGTLLDILSTGPIEKGKEFTSDERIQLIQILFDYINELAKRSDIAIEIQQRAIHFIDKQITLYQQNFNTEDDRKNLYAVLTNNIPEALKIHVAGKVAIILQNSGEHLNENERANAFRAGKAAFLALTPFDNSATIVTSCNDIVANFNTAFTGAGQEKFQERCNDFFGELRVSTEQQLRDNFHRIITVLMNAEKLEQNLGYNLLFSHGNLWNILSGVSENSKRQQTKNETFSIPERIRLVQFMFDYLRTQTTNNQPLKPELQEKAMKFIQEQVRAFQLQGGDIKYILPTLFKQNNFVFLSQSQHNPATKNLLKECFSVVLHDSLHQVARQDDWLIVAKAAGFEKWGKQEITENDVNQFQLNQSQKDEKGSILAVAKGDKAEEDVREKYKDHPFNNYMTIWGQLDRLHPTGPRSVFNFLGAFFRTIAYDLGWKAVMPKSTYKNAIDLENLVINNEIVPERVMTVSSTAGSMGPISNQDGLERAAKIHSKNGEEDDIDDDITLKATHSQYTQIPLEEPTLVTEYRNAKDKKHHIALLSDENRVAVYKQLLTDKIAEKSLMMSFGKSISRSEREVFANCLMKDQKTKSIQSFWNQLSECEKTTFVQELEPENLGKLLHCFKASLTTDNHEDDRKIIFRAIPNEEAINAAKLGFTQDKKSVSWDKIIGEFKGLQSKVVIRGAHEHR